MRVAARAIEERFNADTSDHAGPTVVCDCGGSARYVDRRSKTFDSVLGPLRLDRAYYHCAACEVGFCPRDRALGLDGASVSPGVLRMVGRVGAMVSFEEGHQLLGELAGVEVTAKQVEREAEALGREIAQDEKQVVALPPANDPVPPTLYLGMDGTGVPVRKQELVGRAGKQPDGSAKTREVKLVTVWSAEKRDKKGIPVRDPGSISYSAAIESAAQKDTDDTPSQFAARSSAKPSAAASIMRPAGSCSATGPNGSGTSLPSTSPMPSRSSTASMPSSISPMWPSPSTAPVAICAHSGPTNVTTSWTRGISTLSCLPYGYTRRKMRRRASASTTSRTTANACATPSSGHRDCAPRPGSLRPDARP